MEALCVGCGKRAVRRAHTYCRCCKYRVANGIAVDLDDVPTQEECRRANVAMDEYALDFVSSH